MRKVKTNRRNRFFGLFAMFAMAIGVGVSLAPKEVVKTSASSVTWSYVNVQGGTKIVKGNNTHDGVSFTMATSGSDATVGNWNSGYGGYQIGTSKNKPGTLTFTFGNPWGGSGDYAAYTKILSITFEGNAGNSGGSAISATIGGKPATADPATIARNTTGPTTVSTITPIGEDNNGAIVITVASPGAAFYFKAITITATTAGGGDTIPVSGVTLSPKSLDLVAGGATETGSIK